MRKPGSCQVLMCSVFLEYNVFLEKEFGYEVYQHGKCLNNVVLASQ